MLKVSIIGNLTRDGQLKEIGANTVCNFTLARNDRRTKEVTYVDCSVWGQLATSLSPHLNKGTKVYVEGELGLREWEGQNGKQVNITCRVRDLELVGGGNERRERGETPPQDPLSNNKHNDFDDEIPF